MRHLVLSFALCGLPLSALAQTALEGAEFEAEVTGKTLEFEAGGQSYGVEQYLPGRRVIWAFAGGPCREGRWYEGRSGGICFVYDYDPVPQCWDFRLEDGGLRARFQGDFSGGELVERRRGTAPLSCPGPDIGA